MHENTEIPIDDLQAWLGRGENVSELLATDTATRLQATLGAYGATHDPASAQPGLHWCTAMTASDTDALGADGHPQTGGFLPPVPLPRRMWASSTIAFHAALVVGNEITRRSRIKSVSQKKNATGQPLVFVDIDHSFVQENIVRITETQSLVYRQPANGAQASAMQDQPVDDEPCSNDNSLHITPSTALLFRYSAMTFNAHRIHYDQAYATGVEGYPNLVVQGPLMATLLMSFAANQRPSKPLATFQFRGVAPAFVNEELQLIARNGALEQLELRGPDNRLIMQARATFKQ